MKRFENILKRKKSKFQPGSVERIFEINEESGLDESGNPVIIIKPTPEEKKQKRSIN